MTLRLILCALAVPLLLAGSEAAVIQRLEQKLLSPCCYRQSVADHSSPEATRMRSEIENLVASGRTERQIIDLYKARYGMRILAEPEGPTWWVATLVPAVATLTALLLLAMFLRNYARVRVPEIS